METSRPSGGAARELRAAALIGCALVLGGVAAVALQGGRKVGYDDTPFLPGDKWRVHDGKRPQPRVVDPGTASTPDLAGKPPSDAIVLFDGKDLSKWQTDNGQPARWKVEGGYMEITKGGGTLVSKEQFGDCQLHVEFASPNPPQGVDQGRGNSGVIIMGRYEIQVLDNYGNETYPDGQCGSIYGQYPPLVNACRKPGEWQTYDIIFTAPRFQDGKLVKPAYETVIHNGVLLHNHTEVMGAMTHRALPQYTPHGDRGPLVLQDHGNPVRYRNIWYRELKGYDE
jgi:hypothetical protein